MNRLVEKLIPVGRIFFSVAFIGLGIKHFILLDFVTGRAPAWPDSIPGGAIWAVLTGTIFILAGLSIIFRKWARSTSILVATLIFLWALLRHIPVIAGDAFFGASWTPAGKALVFIGGALAIAATYPKTKTELNTSFQKFLNLKSEFITAGRVCLGVFLLATGVQHFIFTGFVVSLIPGWFPGNAVFWTYFGGVALISGGAGLLIPQMAQWAALLSGIMVFSWFWIIHIPRAFVSVSDGLAVFEALAVSGIAFVIAGFCFSDIETPNKKKTQ